MCAFELFVLILFICALTLLYVPALILIAKRLCIPNKGLAATERSKQFNLLEKGILAAALLGNICLAYGYFVEPYWVEVVRVRIASDKLKNYGQPIKIVQISDLHCDPITRLENNLAPLIAAQKPDLIIFTGDAINSKSALSMFRRLLKQLSDIAPTYAVAGNHDARCWSDLNLYKNTNVKTLNGQSAKLSLSGQAVYLAGVAVDSEAKTAQALKSIPTGAFTLFLYHSPDLIHLLAQQGVDLVCCGHTHGGQVCLPFYGALVTESKYGKQFESGLYRVAQSWLYVNRGIGMEGGLDPRVRFLARPEITVFELTPRINTAANLNKAI